MQDNIENIYNLTPMQAGMLYHKMVDKAPRQYFMQQVIRMNDVLDESILRDSLKLLSSRHDILRTQIVLPKSSGKPRQVVLKDKDIEVTCIDLRLLMPGERERELDKLIHSDTDRGFNLEKDSLLRVTYTRVSEGRSVLIWSVHHIIVDGWSLPILFADFMGFYARLKRGEDREKLLREATRTGMYGPRFSDYIKWQEKQDIRKGLAYWDGVLRGYGSTASIPPMKANRQNSSEVNVVAVNLSKDVSNRLKALSAHYGITLSSILETAWGILLQRYNGTNDVVFGKVVSGRNVRMPGIERMVGLFINTVPVRVRTDGDTTFLQLIYAQQQQALDSERYSYCALNEIQRRSRMGSDLFRTLYVFENYYVDESINGILGDIEMKMDDFTEQTNYPVTLKCIATDRVMMELTYNTGIYSADEALLLGDKLAEFLAGAAREPEARVGDINCLSEVERQMVLEGFNDTYMPFDIRQNIISVYEGNAARQPDAEAIFFGGESWSYGQLNTLSNQIAHRLRGMGVGRGELVILLCRRGAEMVAGMLGIMKAGAAWLPLDPDLPPKRVNMIVEDSGAVAMVTTGTQAYGLPAVNPCNKSLSMENGDNPGITLRPDDLAYCIYTSGTTGMPKGVLVEHRGLTNLYYGSEKMFGLNSGSRVLQYANTMFDATVWDVAMALMSGGTLCIVSDERRLSLSALEQYIAESWATIGLLPPHILTHIDATCMEMVMSGGSASSPAVVRSQNGSEYVNAYGPTEITVCATCWHHDPLQPVPDSIPIGKPLPNVKVYILNGTDICGVGIPGELCVGGEGVARGYLGRPELTAERFIENPYGEGRLYRTGDIARWLPDGNIEYLGRLDEQVKLRGYRIELAEIESALKQQEGILDAAVLVREDSSQSPALYGYIVSGESIDVARLRNRLSEVLPMYMVPSHIVQLERLPLTGSGKLDKDALPTADVQQYGYVPPRNQAEREIATIFGKVLGVEDIGVEDDFFELGGDSMKAMQISALLSRMSRAITVKEIFQLRSVEQIATRLRDLAGTDGQSLPQPAQTASKVMDKHSLLKDIDTQLDDYAQQLLGAGVEQVGELSPAQILTYELGMLSSYGVVRIGQPYDAQKVLDVWNSILQQFELMRCRIDYTGEKKLIQLEYKPVERLPFVDISSYGQDAVDGVMELVAAHTHSYATPDEYDGSIPAHKVLCLRTGDDGFTLLLPISHLIYDAYSNEVINDRFAELYSGEGAGANDCMPYGEYIRLIKEGPLNVSEGEIIERLSLDEFERSLNEHRTKKNHTALATLDYEVSIPEGRDNFDVMLLAERVAAGALSHTYRGGRVPLMMVHTGRSYKGHSHTEEIGEFIDFIPMVFDTTARESGILAAAEEKLRFMREHNISMAALATDEVLGRRFPRIRAILDGIDRSALDIQVINLLLMYDADINTGNAIDESTQPDNMHEATLNNGNLFLNIIRTRDGIMLKNLECPEGGEQAMRSWLDQCIGQQTDK